MPKRPTAVSVFGWFWFGGGILAMLLSWPLARHGQEWYGDLAPGPFWDFPVLFVFFYCFLVSILCVVIGAGLLKGRNWSRFLALGYCFLALFMAFMWFDVSPLLLLNFFVDLAFTLIMWFFLFRPAANAFFRREEGLEAEG
jgi:hypothetical protein